MSCRCRAFPQQSWLSFVVWCLLLLCCTTLHPVQEPGPAKVTVTSGASADGIPRLPGGIAGAERVPMGRATSWREENRRSRPTAPWSRSASFLGRPERSQMGSTGATQDGRDD